jgi:phytoene synthase
MTEASDEAARQVVREAARSTAFDRYLAALLTPEPARSDLIALAAYLGELARIPLTVKEPALADIRLQWWEDAIGKIAGGGVTGNPIADELGKVMTRHGVPPELVVQPIRGRARELAGERIADEAAFRHYLSETEGAAFRIAAIVLGVRGDACDEIAEHAGAAWGRVGLALALPRHLAHRRLPLPQTRFTGSDPRLLPRLKAAAAMRDLTIELAVEARARLGKARAAAEAREARAPLAAFLPLALVEPYLRALGSPSHDPLVGFADISPLTRVSRLWWARWRQRF